MNKTEPPERGDDKRCDNRMNPRASGSLAHYVDMKGTWMSPPNASFTIRGAMTALVTPFRNNQVDWERVASLVERQIKGGADWLVPCGTTGESPTLSEEEHARIIETVIKQANGRVPVMAGTGSNCTAHTIELTRRAASLGADAALIVTPYYNRPPQEGLFRHYAAVAESCQIPIVLYNVPVRTGVSLSNDTVVRLRERFPHIVAIKHATGSVDGVSDLRARSDIAILSGDDAVTWPLLSLGAVGLISVVSNLVPELVKSMVAVGLQGNVASALALHHRVHDLAEGLAKFGPNPLPIKTAMAAAGLLEPEFRLPLVPVDETARAGVVQLLKRHEIAVR